METIMAYSKTGLSLVDLANNAGQASIFKYATTDAIATVQGANYFAFNSSDAEDLGNLLKAYDFILIGASDDSDVFYVTSVSPIVIAKTGSQSSDITLATNQILVGDANSKAAAVAMSGDVAIVAAGTTTIQDNAITTNKINAEAVTQAKIADNAINLAKVATYTMDGSIAKNVGAADANSGLALIYRVDLPGGASGGIDLAIGPKTRVVDAWCVLQGAGTTSDTVRLINGTGSNYITNAMDISGSDQSIVRASTIDDAYWDVAAAGTLRVFETDGGGSDSPACTVFISVIQVA